MDPNSHVSAPADRAVWQFSLRQCLVVIAWIAILCGVYRATSMGGWILGMFSVFYAVHVVPTRRVLTGLLLGAFFGTGSAVMAVAADYYSNDRDVLPSISIAFVFASMVLGANIGTAASLIRNRRTDINGHAYIMPGERSGAPTRSDASG